MILPSKDSPTLQRAAVTQNNEALKAAVNNPADNNKNNSKRLNSITSTATLRLYNKQSQPKWEGGG